MCFDFNQRCEITGANCTWFVCDQELSKELLSVRRQVKEGNHSETISQSSRTSSSNSLNTVEQHNTANKKTEKVCWRVKN